MKQVKVEDEDEASEGFGHELEVEEEDSRKKTTFLIWLLVQSLRKAKSLITPADPMFVFWFTYVSHTGISRVTQNVPCLVVFACM